MLFFLHSPFTKNEQKNKQKKDKLYVLYKIQLDVQKKTTSPSLLQSFIDRKKKKKKVTVVGMQPLKKTNNNRLDLKS